MATGSIYTKRYFIRVFNKLCVCSVCACIVEQAEKNIKKQKRKNDGKSLLCLLTFGSEFYVKCEENITIILHQKAQILARGEIHSFD